MNKKSSNKRPEIVTAAILIIGDEILSGRTKDSNVNYIACHLTEIGIRLREVRVIGDDEEAIITSLNELRAQHDYVFTTGGIGPTHDDITAQAVANALRVPLIEDARALDMMRQHYSDDKLTAARRRMALVPEGAQLIQNSISFAPGFMIKNVITMAGVPAIMQVMLDDITPKLRVGKLMQSITIVYNQPESTIAAKLEELQCQYTDVSFGSYPFFKDGNVGTQLVLRSTNKSHLNSAKKALNNYLESL